MARGGFRMLRALAGMEAVVATSRHAFARHTHDRFGIGVIERGAQKSLSGRGVVEAGAGDVITVNPGEVHDGLPIDEAGRDWKILYLDPVIVCDVVRDISEGRAATAEFPYPVMQDERIAAGFHSLFASVTGEASDGLASEERLVALLAIALRERPDARPAPSVAIAAARSLIDDDPLGPITLAKLAKVSGLSRFQLLRAFAKATGFTPHAYLIQRRIDLARGLIVRGTALAEAALASGFADQSHMTRVFVRKYGVSPGAYAAAMT